MPQHRISKRSQRAWARLSSWYGARLQEQYGPNPPDDWCEIFDRTDDERLQHGMLTARRESPIHPITLGQLEAAIPAKHGAVTRQSVPDVLCEAATRKFNPCQHQSAAGWNFFGPLREFVSKHAGGDLVTHPDVRGVQIPACAECDRPSLRLLLDEITT